MKKIIFVHLLNDFSGSPKVLSQVIKTANEKGFDVELFTGKGGTGFLMNLVKKHNFYFYKRFDNKFGTLFSFIVSQVHLFFKILKFRKENAAIYVNTLLPFGAALAGKLINKEVIYHIHETSIRPQLLKKFLRWTVKKTASKIIFVSNSLREEEKFENIKEYTIYNAISNDFLNDARNNSFSPFNTNKKFKVLMICSLRLYKGISEFLEIAEKCKEYKMIEFQLILNAEQNEVKTFFNELEYSSNLNILSKQKDIKPFYKEVSLVINLSRIDEWVETFGLTIIEAMANGIPVIVPPVGGPSEIVHDGVEGYLISSYHTELISKKIIELSKSSELWTQLSSNAKNRVHDFNEQIFEEKILNCIYE
tara:strand:- start:3053 stop:4144 length:1092 start_codon:yes stop_codon:yes gene_type:complete